MLRRARLRKSPSSVPVPLRAVSARKGGEHSASNSEGVAQLSRQEGRDKPRLWKKV